MTVYSKIKKKYLEQISTLTNEYRLMLWQELLRVNLVDFNDFLRENSLFVRLLDIKNMTYLRYYGESGEWYEADFSKMPLDYITEVFNQLEIYASKNNSCN